MTTNDDPTDRAGKLMIAWEPSGLIGRVELDGAHWASVEWSEKRQQWCIEDVEGRCLTHAASIRGQAASKEEAVALAEAMIRDGRVPSPAEARAEAEARLPEDEKRRRIAREKRAKQPAQIKRSAERQAAREAVHEAWRLRSEVEFAEREAQPLYETLDEAFDLSDPDLWKSNSFAALKPRLILHVEAAIVEFASDIAYQTKRGMAQPFGTSGKAARGWRKQECEHAIARLQPKLDRAQAIYRKLTGAEWAPRQPQQEGEAVFLACEGGAPHG
jgi:hypothetical protein